MRELTWKDGFATAGEAADALIRMVKSPEYALYENRLRMTEAQLVRKLVVAVTIEEVKHYQGEIESIRKALSLPREIAKELNSEKVHA